VAILKVPAFTPDFFRFTLPFVPAALLALSLSLVFSAPVSPEGAWFLKDPPPPLGEAEYRAHAAFQASFSYRPLGSGGGEGYFDYVLGDDGLIAGKTVHPPPGKDIPPFPLKDLMFFLETGGNAAPDGRGPFTLKDLALVFLIVLFSFPAFIRPAWGDKKRKNRLLYKEKGIAA
jgi:hypothetical protein